MLQWLKDILGDSYTEDIDKQISKQIGKDFVARADFNALSETKKTLETQISDRDKQLDQLKTSTGNSEELQKKIEQLQETNKQAKKDHEAEMTKLRIDSAVTATLTAAKAKNSIAVKALLDLKNVKLEEDGTVAGLKEQLDKLKKSEDTKFLFEDNKLTIKGAAPGESTDSKPKGVTKEDFNKMSYKEKLNLYNTDKETYDTLASVSNEQERNE